MSELLYVLVSIHVIGVPLSVAVFREAIANFNRSHPTPDQVIELPTGLRCLLIGVSHVTLGGIALVGLLFPIQAVLFYGALTPLETWGEFVAVSIPFLLTMTGLLWFLKALLITAYVPCRFATASHIAWTWSAYEILLWGSLYVPIAVIGWLFSLA